jgi:hypothetical protein
MRLAKHDELVEEMRIAIGLVGPYGNNKQRAIEALDALLEAVVRLEVGYPALCTDEGIAYPPIEGEQTHVIIRLEPTP